MSDRFLVVVGNKFAEFAHGKDALTLSQLAGMLALPASVMMAPGRLVLVPGQGLGAGDVAAVLRQAEVSAHRDHFDLDLFRTLPARAPAALTHKRVVDNTLISAPRRLAEDRFEMDLLVAEDTEMMADHQTGQHLQGMLLIEAARQSFIAVAESFLLPETGERHYFVFDDLSARYHRFAFPVGARLDYRVAERETSASRHRFTVEVVIEQGGRAAATITGTFTAIKAARVERMEQGLAREALAAELAEAGQRRRVLAEAA